MLNFNDISYIFKIKLSFQIHSYEIKLKNRVDESVLWNFVKLDITVLFSRRQLVNLLSKPFPEMNFLFLIVIIRILNKYKKN